MLVIAITAIWNVNFNSQIKGMSGVMLANVEALAEDEAASGDSTRAYKKTESTWIEYETINGVYMKCRYSQCICEGKGETVCIDNYSKNCSKA